MAHTLAEISTRYNLNELSKQEFESEKDDLLATEDGEKFYNEEMQEHARDYAQLIYEKLQEAKTRSVDAFAELEVQVDFSKWVPEGSPAAGRTAWPH